MKYVYVHAFDGRDNDTWSWVDLLGENAEKINFENFMSARAYDSNSWKTNLLSLFISWSEAVGWQTHRKGIIVSFVYPSILLSCSANTSSSLHHQYILLQYHGQVHRSMTMSTLKFIFIHVHVTKDCSKLLHASWFLYTIAPSFRKQYLRLNWIWNCQWIWMHCNWCDAIP